MSDGSYQAHRQALKLKASYRVEAVSTITSGARLIQSNDIQSKLMKISSNETKKVLMKLTLRSKLLLSDCGILPRFVKIQTLTLSDFNLILCNNAAPLKIVSNLVVTFQNYDFVPI